MDTARLRTYVIISGILLLFVASRAAVNTSPIYSVFEPVIERLDTAASRFSLINTEVKISDQESVQLQQLKDENDQLRELIDLPNSEVSVLAEITRRNLLSFEKTVWIGVGSESGIKQGQTVTHEGQLFGVVKRVYKSSAEIQTIIDPTFRATVAIDDEQGVLVVDHGSILVDLVPDKRLTGKLASTNGIDGQFAAGVAVGLLGEITSDEGAVFATYQVIQSQNVYSAEFLEVITSGGAD